MMIECIEDAEQCIGNIVEIVQGQIAFVELSVRELMVDEFVNEDEDFIGALVWQRANGGFDHIGNHADTGFACLRSWPRIAIVFFLNAVLLFFCSLIEVFNSARTVVSGDEIHDILRQMIFSGDIESISFVGFEDEGTHIGFESVMRVVAALIFSEVLCILDLSDIVVIAADAGENSVCTDGLGCGFVERSYHNGVLISAGCFEEQGFERGMFEV